MTLAFITFLGAVLLALGVTGLFVYGAIVIIIAPYKRVREQQRNHKAFRLTRSAANPLLTPSAHEFENQAVFNPAAVHDGDTTHLFYRALGSDGVSRIGYATSKDGITIDERLPYPVFSLENADPHLNALRRLYAEKMHPELVASGGSWGGTEDPRAVLMDGRVYLTFSAFQHWDSVRMAVASIDLKDLQEKRWKWTKPTFLSPQNQVHKNWVMFPEKIKGAFAFLHSISPTVEIAYRSSINGIGSSEPIIESPTGARVQGRKGRWDTRMRGAGAAPIKTEKGWLVFYHATDHEKLSHLYQLGAMLLDLSEPSKVIAQSPVSVLTPSAAYEMNGTKPGVVYACGATAHDDTLSVYYGAADTCACVATTPLSTFVSNLIRHEPVLPQPIMPLLPVGV